MAEAARARSSPAGVDVLNPVLFAGEDLADVELDSLPERFFVKCTHGSRWNVAVADKRAADWAAITERVRHWLSLNYCELSSFVGAPRSTDVEDLPRRPLSRQLDPFEKSICPRHIQRFPFRVTGMKPANV
jgi:hypothetical protein